MQRCPTSVTDAFRSGHKKPIDGNVMEDREEKDLNTSKKKRDPQFTDDGRKAEITSDFGFASQRQDV